VYRTGDDGLEETNYLHHSGSCLFTGGSNLTAYSKDYDVDTNSLTVSSEDSVSFNSGGDIGVYYDSANDRTFVAWGSHNNSQAPSSGHVDAPHIRLYKYEHSTDSFTYLDRVYQTSESLNKYAVYSHIDMDDEYIYALGGANASAGYSGSKQHLTVCSYSASSLTNEESTYYIWNGYSVSNTRYGITTYDNGSDVQYILIGYRELGSSSSGSQTRSLRVYTYDKGTDTLTHKLTSNIGTTDDEIKHMCNDGTYFYVLFWDNSATKTYLQAYSYDGNTTLTEEDSVEISSANDVKRCVFSDDYIYVTRDDDILVYSFDGTDLSSVTTCQTGNSSGQLYGITVDSLDYIFSSQDADTDTDSNNVALFEPSKVQVSQLYTLVNYTPSANSVTLNNPQSISCRHKRNIKRVTFPSGNYKVYDYGRNSKTLEINGVEYSSADTKMNTLKTMCHYGAKVTLSGLDDTNLNTDYMITDFEFNEPAGHVNRYYEYRLSLEEV
jgi:hypothetical protein